MKITPDNATKVEDFRLSLYREAENLFSQYIPSKIEQLGDMLKEDAFNVTDMSTLCAPLDIPIPDPPAPEDEEMETNESEGSKKKKAPKCGFIKGNDEIVALLNRVKPEINGLRETILTMSTWIRYNIPKIEDGNDFGVAIQENILERITTVKTKVDGYQTSVSKYFSERGDAVAKASKEIHVMDYRSLVRERDRDQYPEIKVILQDILGFYAELHDIINKNLDKVTNPKGEEKPSMY